MNKKGVELSMNVIIIAALGLLVLVILAVLVIGGGNKTVSGMQACNALGGTCESTCGSREVIPDGKCTLAAKPQCCKVFSLQ